MPAQPKHKTLSRLLELLKALPRQRWADGRTEVCATVADSWKLRWWILARGAAVEVLAPVWLRREIAQAHREAANR